MEQNKQHPKVSYLIPSYNHEMYIKKAIDSVLEQTYPNIELIVCDDCSTDNSDAFLKDYAAQKGFLYIRNEQNIGVAKTLNKLVEMATGEYFASIASDDWIESTKVEEQVEYLQRTGYDGVLGPVISYYQDDDRYQKQQTEELIDIFEKENGYLYRLYHPHNSMCLIQSGMLKLSCMKQIGGCLDGYKADDWLLMIRFLQAGYSVGFLNRHLTYYRIHGNNSYLRVEYILNEVQMPVIRDFIPKKFRKVTLSDAYATAAQKYWYQKKPGASLKYQLKSLVTRFQIRHFIYFSKLNVRYLLMKLKILK